MKKAPKNHRHSVTFKDFELEEKVLRHMEGKQLKFTDFAEKAFAAYFAANKNTTEVTVIWQGLPPDRLEFNRALNALKELGTKLLSARASIERTMPRDSEQLQQWCKHRLMLERLLNMVTGKVNQLINLSKIARCPEDCRALDELYDRALKGEVTNSEIVNLLRFWTGKNFGRFSNAKGCDVA